MSLRDLLAALVLTALLGAGAAIQVYTWRPMPPQPSTFPCGYALRGGFCPMSSATGTRPMHDIAPERS